MRCPIGYQSLPAPHTYGGQSTARKSEYEPFNIMTLAPTLWTLILCLIHTWSPLFVWGDYSVMLLIILLNPRVHVTRSTPYSLTTVLEVPHRPVTWHRKNLTLSCGKLLPLSINKLGSKGQHLTNSDNSGNDSYHGHTNSAGQYR